MGPPFPPPPSAANWLKPPGLEQKKGRHTPRYLTPAYWHNNSRKLLFLCAYTCLNLLLFITAMLKNAEGGFWYMVAKGCGQCLNFNCTFVMVREIVGKWGREGVNVVWWIEMKRYSATLGKDNACLLHTSIF